MPAQSRPRAGTIAGVATGTLLAVFALSFLPVHPGADTKTHTGVPGRKDGSTPLERQSSARVHAAVQSEAAGVVASDPEMDFAREATAALALRPEQQRAALNAIYFEWGRREPERAVQSALAIAPSGWRSYALESALAGWSHAAPAELAETALAFPDGVERRAALTKAIRAWLASDPERAGAWIVAHAETMELTEAIIRAENR